MTQSRLPMASSTEGGAAAVMWSTLSAGDIETRYRWAGRGGVPIVVLAHPACTPEARDDERCLAVIEALVSAGRVLLPERATMTPPANPMRDASLLLPWLSGFLEGVGLDRLWIVAPAAYARELHVLRGANPGQIVRVVLVGELPQDPIDEDTLVTGSWPSAIAACMVRPVPSR